MSAGKHRGFGFIEFEVKEDAGDAIDNMNNAELYGRTLRVNYAQPMKIKGGEKGFSHQAVWADSDNWWVSNQMNGEACMSLLSIRCAIGLSRQTPTPVGFCMSCARLCSTGTRLLATGRPGHTPAGEGACRQPCPMMHSLQVATCLHRAVVPHTGMQALAHCLGTGWLYCHGTCVTPGVECCRCFAPQVQGMQCPSPCLATCCQAVAPDVVAGANWL